MFDITYTKTRIGSIDIHVNTIKAGEFLMDIDGYWKFFPEWTRRGYVPGYVLRELADKEEELNKEWDFTVRNDPCISGTHE